jgi:ABC-type nitrate/sulfonate/bicarbonate transport system ATPase subunit
VLADHIVVLGGRPARVVSRRNIHLPHPRDGLGDAVAEVARSIRADLVTAAGLQSVRGASP